MAPFSASTHRSHSSSHNGQVFFIGTFVLAGAVIGVFTLFVKTIRQRKLFSLVDLARSLSWGCLGGAIFYSLRTPFPYIAAALYGTASGVKKLLVKKEKDNI